MDDKGIYGIMRVEKRKMKDIGGLQAEHERTETDRDMNFDRSTIDWDETAHNEHLISSGNWGKVIKERSEREGWKIRKGTKGIDSNGRDTDKSSVVFLDALYTASPEWFAQNDRDAIDSYFRDCLQYHIDTYCQGDNTRVLSATIHWDEATPHMHVASIPLIDDGIKIRLSAKDVMGNKVAYRARQQSFYDKVTKSRGMERGDITKRPEERKRHQTVQEFKIAKNTERLEQQARQEEAIRQATKTTVERRDSIRKELNEAKQERDEAIRERDTARSETNETRQQNDQLRKDNKALADQQAELQTGVSRLQAKLHDLSEQVLSRIRRRRLRPEDELTSSEHRRVLDEGGLTAIYADGHAEKLPRGGYKNPEVYRIRTDEENGLCTIGVIEAEPILSFPAHVVQEIMNKIPRTHRSADLNEALRPMEAIEDVREWDADMEH